MINRKMKAGALRYLKQRIKDSQLEAAGKIMSEAVLRRGDEYWAEVVSVRIQQKLEHEQKLLHWLIEQVEVL